MTDRGFSYINYEDMLRAESKARGHKDSKLVRKEWSIPPALKKRGNGMRQGCIIPACPKLSKTIASAGSYVGNGETKKDEKLKEDRAIEHKHMFIVNPFYAEIVSQHEQKLNTT